MEKVSLEIQTKIEKATQDFRKGFDSMQSVISDPEIFVLGVEGKIDFKTRLNKKTGKLMIKANIELALPGA